MKLVFILSFLVFSGGCSTTRALDSEDNSALAEKPVTEKEFNEFINSLPPHKETHARNPWTFKPVDDYKFEHEVNSKYYFTYKKWLYVGFYHQLTFFYPWINWLPTEKGKVMSKAYFKGQSLGVKYEESFQKHRLDGIIKYMKLIGSASLRLCVRTKSSTYK